MGVKQKSRMSEANEEIFFINVPEPKDVRKNLLEASQQILEGMKSYEKYKKLKAEKLRKIEQLKTTTIQIRELAGKLRACLPTVKGIPEKAKASPLAHVTEIELGQLNAEIKKLEEELRVLK